LVKHDSVHTVGFEPFASSFDHVLAELKRVDILIADGVRRFRAAQDDPYRGLYISDADVDDLLRSLAREGEPRAPETREALIRLDAAIAGRLSAQVEPDMLRLRRLARLFGLGALDCDILLVCLAPEVSLKYEKLFAYLQDDMTQRRPTVDLALELLCESLPERMAARARLEPDAPLRRAALVECFDESAAGRSALPARRLRLDPRVAAYLLGSDAVDDRLRAWVELVPARRPASGSRELELYLGRAERVLRAEGPALLRLVGSGAGLRRRWAEALCARLGLTMLAVDCAALEPRGEEAAALLRLVAREARLQDAAVYFDEAGAAPQGAARRVIAEIARERLAFAACREEAEADAYLSNRAPPPIAVAPPAPDERARLWREALGEGAAAEVVSEIPALAAQFRFGGEEIAELAQAARVGALWRGATESAAADLFESCRERSRPRLGTLARRAAAHRDWRDLVLPEDAHRQLREICDGARHRAQIMETYGFGRKSPGGRGLSVLFAGPSGVGKTLAAEVMAQDLGLDLYRIDLSAVVSKYIGETERNLAQVFGAAEEASAILFFDEADALFGKRSEVQDAHDRYANVETSYLLQRMEDYRGISILATNLRRNMDDAFTRRIAHIVQFPAPEPAERLRLWRGVFPEETPRADDLDFEFLAQAFTLTGANIKTIALTAAGFAAAERGSVAMRHLVRATRREFQKLGKTVPAAEFGVYAEFLSDR
jgi:hypothetical protein